MIISDRWESKAYILGTSDFDAHMSGLKFWTGDENQRPVYKKPFLAGSKIKSFVFLGSWAFA